MSSAEYTYSRATAGPLGYSRPTRVAMARVDRRPLLHIAVRLGSATSSALPRNTGTRSCKPAGTCGAPVGSGGGARAGQCEGEAMP